MSLEHLACQYNDHSLAYAAHAAFLLLPINVTCGLSGEHFAYVRSAWIIGAAVGASNALYMSKGFESKT